MFLIRRSSIKYLLPAIPPACCGTGIGIANFLLSSDSVDSGTLVYSRFLFTAFLTLDWSWIDNRYSVGKFQFYEAGR